MQYLLLGLLGLVVGVYWLKSKKPEGDSSLLRVYYGIGSLIAGAAFLYLGIITILGQ